jgi:hypothetical protein
VLLKLPPAPQEGLATAILVQAKDGGRIVGAVEAAAPAR